MLTQGTMHYHDTFVSHLRSPELWCCSDILKVYFHHTATHSEIVVTYSEDIIAANNSLSFSSSFLFSSPPSFHFPLFFFFPTKDLERRLFWFLSTNILVTFLLLWHDRKQLMGGKFYLAYTSRWCFHWGTSGKKLKQESIVEEAARECCLLAPSQAPA